MLRLCRAELRLVPAVPYKDPGNYVRVSDGSPRSWRSTEPHGAIWANQFDNVANRRAHYETTGAGDLGADRRRASTRSSRRSAPAGRSPASAWRSRNANRACASSSPIRWARRCTTTTRTATLKAEGTSITEGIGQGRITKNLEGAPVDGAVQIGDAEAVPIIFDLLSRGGAGGRRLDRYQHRRSHRRRPSARSGPYDRDDALRLRHALSEQAVQSGVPSLEGATGARLARMIVLTRARAAQGRPLRGAKWSGTFRYGSRYDR